MLTSPYIKGLAAYFSKSACFYHIVTDMEGRFIYVNPIFQKQFYHLSPDFKEALITDTLDTADKKIYKQALLNCLEKGNDTFQAGLKMKQADGSLTLIHWEFFVNRNDESHPESILAIGSMINETEPLSANDYSYVLPDKKNTQENAGEIKLTDSELFYRHLFVNSLDGMLLTDDKGIIRFASPSITAILGYTAEEVVGKDVFDFAHPEDRSLAYAAFMDELANNAEYKFISIRLLNKQNDWIWCIVRGHNLMKDPYVKGIVVYFYDDTLRKKTEDALIESEDRFRNMIYNLNVGVVLQNERTEILVCNKAALDMLGLTENQLLGKTSFDPVWNVIHENGKNFPGHSQPVMIAIQTKKPVREVVMGVYRPVTNDRVWLLVNAEPVLDAENNIIQVICSFTDISERKRLSQELVTQEIQKQKLITQATIDGQEKERSEMGKELHDNISQQLANTRLYIEIAKEKATGEVLEMITHAHKGLTDIINEIKNLSQSLVPPSLGDVGMIESIQDLCGALIRTHAFGIEFHHRYFNENELPDNMKLMLYRIIQEQVNNIIRHARATHIIIRLQADAEQIILSISDNGKGFDLHQHKKGQGITNMINRAGLFNGKVFIETAAGNGCTLSVTIPVV